jgi:hypothetical protein
MNLSLDEVREAARQTGVKFTSVHGTLYLEKGGNMIRVTDYAPGTKFPYMHSTVVDAFEELGVHRPSRFFGTSSPLTAATRT